MPVSAGARKIYLALVIPTTSYNTNVRKRTVESHSQRCAGQAASNVSEVGYYGLS